MYDLVKIGQYEFQINPYYSQGPVQYVLSGKDVDGAIIMLDLKKEDFEGTVLEGKEGAVLAQVANIRKMLLNDEIETVVGKQNNITEIECDDKSNALIIITVKDSSNESKVKESFANCTTITRK